MLYEVPGVHERPPPYPCHLPSPQHLDTPTSSRVDYRDREGVYGEDGQGEEVG